MHRRYVLTGIILFSLFSITPAKQFTPETVKKITFPSSDALLITGDLYFIHDTLPYMILCHQAGYSRGEYRETASKFSNFGYNCIAIDQRSGNAVNGVKNETAAYARSRNLPTSYLDAEKDIVAAIDYAYVKSGKKVFVVGSSYSASLVLKIAAVNPKVSAVMSFSPGEYFGNKLKLNKEIATLTVPAFVSSSKKEASEVYVLMSGVKSTSIHQFIPTTEGKHGSSCLWRNNPGYHEYWFAILQFMKQLK